MTTFTQSRNDQIEARAQYIESEIKPNIYAVGTLVQGMYTGMWWDGNRDLYHSMASHFIDRLTVLTGGKNALKRFGKRLPSAVTIEGLNRGSRIHLNFLIHKPDWKDEVEFEQHMIDEWRLLEWGRRDFRIDHIEKDPIRYSLKFGPDSLLFITK